jgi:rhodanese-related sulfurtransferase
MQKITTDEVKRRLDAGEPLVFIDARSDESWSQSNLQIPNSLRVPPDRADEFVGAIPPDVGIITYCT